MKKVLSIPRVLANTRLIELYNVAFEVLAFVGVYAGSSILQQHIPFLFLAAVDVSIHLHALCAAFL